MSFIALSRALAVSVHLFAALCSGDPVAKPVSKGWRSQEYVPLQRLQPSRFLLHRCLGHTPHAPLGRFYHHPYEAGIHSPHSPAPVVVMTLGLLRAPSPLVV